MSSLVFYAWGEPVYVVLMLFSTAVDYFHGQRTDFYLRNGQKKKAKFMVLSSVMINLGLLGFFKYADFIIGNINGLAGMEIPLLELPLPIGISFYTFQTMSYTIDIYRREAPVQKNIVSFGAYVALFPQLIAGPIVRYQTIAEQLMARRITMNSFEYGVLRFCVGLGKKVLLANNIGMLWDQISRMEIARLSAATAWVGAAAFAFQIYFDFSGYSDMAIGLGKMFGFTFHENFQYPYESRSITEFWRRWHISLGTWFREYVYIPLGGNRKGTAKQIRNIMIVWLLTGFWHGANWNFVLWGVYFGIILMAEKLFLLNWLEKLPGIVRHLYALLLVLVSWVLFAHDSIREGAAYLKVMFGMGENLLFDRQTGYLLLNYGLLFLILILGSTKLPRRLAERLGNSFGISVFCKAAFVSGILVLVTAYLVDASYNPFLYFRF